MSAHRVLLQCSGDFEIATNCVDIDLIWSFLTTFCGHSWVQYREVHGPEANTVLSRGQGRVLFLQSWSVDWKSEEILIFTVLWDRSILSKTKYNAIYLLCYHSNEILWLLFNYFCYECNWQIVVELELESCA